MQRPNLPGKHMLKQLAGCISLAAVVFLQGCASTKEQPNVDPFEPVNRVIFSVNDIADTYVLRPVARGYNWVTPEPARNGIGNFFDNLTYPVTIVNGLLQAKWGQAGSDSLRFLMNSTFGLLGFMDVATDAGLEAHNEDFGQTFAHWGIPAGPYIMLPLFGPRTARSGIGTLFDVQVNPLVQLSNTSVRDKLLILWFIESRAALVGPDEAIRDAFDPYLFLRDAYLQNREFLINDGAQTEAEFFDEDFEDF
jgi:phospholipid-binding lipoprotein MlaA